MRLVELLEKVGGTLVHGSGDLEVTGVNTASRARATEISFAEDAAAVVKALSSQAGVLVLGIGLDHTGAEAKCVVEASRPRLWFARAAGLLRPALPVGGVHTAAVVSSTAKLGKNVTVGPCAVIGEAAEIGAGSRIEAGAVVGDGVRIGENCRIFPRVTIYPGTEIGCRVTVHAGAVLGADGFGYGRDPETGAYTQFPQQGRLVIEDDVEIGANTTIDRGSLSETRIRRGAKFDNLVHVGHNCEIGEDAILVALTGVSGSSSIGRGAVLAGQVGIGDHAQIGPGVILGGQAGVFSGKRVASEGLPPGTVFYGTPARPLRQVLREQAILSRLASKKAESRG